MLTMGQFSNIPLVIYNVYTVPQRAIDCRPGLGGRFMAQPSDFLCLENLWQIYQHLYQMYKSEGPDVIGHRCWL